MRLVALDTETHLIQPGLLAPPLVCVTIAGGSMRNGDDSLDEWVLLDKRLGVTRARELLQSDAALVFHNAAFDLAVLCATDPDLVPVVFAAYRAGRIKDTKIRQELLDIAAGRKQEGGGTIVLRKGEWRKADYSLAGLVRQYLGRDRSDEKDDPNGWRKRFAELEDVPVNEWPEAARTYALQDAVDTLAVYEAQGQAIPTEDDQTRAAWGLHLMACWGMRTEAELVAHLKAALTEQQRKNRATLLRAHFLTPKRCTPAEVEAGKVEFWEEGKRGPRPMRWAKDQKRVEEYTARVYGRKKRTPPFTESGRVATDKDTLYQSGSRLLKLVADGGGVDKILTTYVPVLERGTVIPINPRFNVLVNSGRTSCAEPNLQNLPTGRRVGGVREAFVPRDGFLFTSVDYDTLELRALAQMNLWLFGKSRMAEVINEGRDLHSAMAAEMLGLPYDQIEANKKTKGSPEKRARDAAKVANFGYPGGLGAQSLVDYARKGYGVALTVEQAARLKADWLRMWPEMRDYFAYVNGVVGLGDAVITHPATGFVRGGVGYTDGCNHYFQHLAATGAKRAVFAVAEECYTDPTGVLFGSRPVAFIHDEILAEVPVDRASAAAHRIAEVMCREMQALIPDVTITASPALMRRWFKDATDVYDQNGALVPWESKAA